jgi:tetratricopeptide (TPR) repeat protein
MQRGDEARDWLERADGALARMGGNDALEAFVASRRASVLQSLEHRPELALPLLERVVATNRRLFGVHPNTERELLNLGNTYEALGRTELALTTYQEAQAMTEQLYGPDSLRTGVSAAQDLTQAANRSGAHDRALALGQRGLQLIDAGGGALPVLVPASCVTTADALLALGRAPEALPLCDRGLAAQEQARALDPEKVVEWDGLRCRGEALLATHRAREAIAPLERSVTLTRREWPGDLARARFALARALVDAGGDAARARSLAQDATSELASRPELAVEAAGVTAWLRTAIPP